MNKILITLNALALAVLLGFHFLPQDAQAPVYVHAAPHPAPQLAVMTQNLASTASVALASPSAPSASLVPGRLTF